MIDWRPMDELPTQEGRFMFWLDWADDCAKLNDPLPNTAKERFFVGTFRGWCSLYKATHWALMPSPPRN